MSGKVVLITGATQGIGKESAVALASMGATVVMVGRDKARSEAALADVKARSRSDSVELLLADLSSMAEVRRLAADFKARHDQLHVLLNNAGALQASRKQSPDGLEMTFAVNHVAYFLLTDLLLPVLKASAPSRIVNVASDAHRGLSLDFDDLQSEKRYFSFPAYGRSKLANILFTYELARRLQGTGVTANALHPGVIASGFGKNDKGWFALGAKLMAPFLMTPEKGARTSVYLASSPEVEGVSGRYFKRSKPIKSSRQSYDEAAQKKLWDATERVIARSKAVAA
jgi:NAD(P)-dependent dehydrogenase (short-subunit alcohol dehydrogenase family)